MATIYFIVEKGTREVQLNWVDGNDVDRRYLVMFNRSNIADTLYVTMVNLNGRNEWACRLNDCDDRGEDAMCMFTIDETNDVCINITDDDNYCIAVTC